MCGIDKTNIIKNQSMFIIMIIMKIILKKKTKFNKATITTLNQVFI